ncbi:hypothetical protein SAMN02787076_01905 [Rhizobacter sp. OV335]|nr:hypothetical protein SAMN02787076_01905 [Rhizobacter sp. OV335]
MDLARLRDGTQTVNGRQQIDWRTMRAHVNSIVASGDFQTRFTLQQQSEFLKLQKLNTTDAGRSGRFAAWSAVKSMLPRGAGSPAELQKFRVLLDRLISGGAWMEKDEKALLALCQRERFKSFWGAELSTHMWRLERALVRDDKSARQCMVNLLQALNSEFQSA